MSRGKRLLAFAVDLSRTSDRDHIFARILKNVFHVVSGNSSAVALGLIALALMAHALGPARLGILVMIESYAKLIDQLIRLETWQVLVRHGAEALEIDRPSNFLRLVKFGIIIELCGAVTAAAIAFLAVPIAAHWLNWDGETIGLARIFSVSLVFGISSTAIGVLRLFDRFASMAWLEPWIAGFRLALIAVAAALDAPLWVFVGILIFAQCVHRLALSLMAWREMRRRDYSGLLGTSLEGVVRESPGIWSLLGAANATVLIRKSTQELDVLVVGGILGPAAVGIYQIARRLGQSVIKLGATLQQIAFPDLARLWIRGERERFLKLVKQIELLTGTFALGFVLVLAFSAELIVTLIAGPEFKEAAIPLIVQSTATFLFLCGSTLRPALMSMGLQVPMLLAVILSAAAFYAALFIGVPRLGVVGASIAHLVFNALWLPAVTALFLLEIREESRRSRVRSHSARE